MVAFGQAAVTDSLDLVLSPLLYILYPMGAMTVLVFPELTKQADTGLDSGDIVGWVIYWLHTLAQPALLMLEWLNLDKVATFMPSESPRALLATEFVAMWALLMMQVLTLLVPLLAVFNPFN